MRILVSGGGTGGHVYPILAVVSALRTDEAGDQTQNHRHRSSQRPPADRSHGSDTPTAGADRQRLPIGRRLRSNFATSAKRAASRRGWPRAPASRSRAVETGQIRGRAPWIVARNLARMAQGVRQCAEIIREFRPDVVFITGGYVAAPVAWAAWRARHACRC